MSERDGGAALVIGERVLLEPDNNGPISRGEVIKCGAHIAMVRWDDGTTTPQHVDNLQAEPEA